MDQTIQTLEKLKEVLKEPEIKKARTTTYGIRFFLDDSGKSKIVQMNELMKELMEAWKDALKEFESLGLKYSFEIWEDVVYLVVFVPLENENLENKDKDIDGFYIMEDGKVYKFGKYSIMRVEWDDNNINLFFPKI